MDTTCNLQRAHKWFPPFSRLWQKAFITCEGCNHRHGPPSSCWTARSAASWASCAATRQLWCCRMPIGDPWDPPASAQMMKRIGLHPLPRKCSPSPCEALWGLSRNGIRYKFIKQQSKSMPIQEYTNTNNKTPKEQAEITRQKLQCSEAPLQPPPSAAPKTCEKALEETSLHQL